jgi:primary-amine oxidase
LAVSPFRSRERLEANICADYDYQVNYYFYLDGSVQVIVRASGYIAWTEWTDDPEDPSYGFHIRPNNSGSMHDHVLNFKLDLDIHGTANSLLKTQFVPEVTSYPWSEGREISTMKVERSFITTEDEGKINWAPNAAAAYSVVNTDEPNEYGEYPGFRIYPSVGSAIHSTIENSTLLGNTINWATHHLYALQRKDSEPSSTYLLGTNNIETPLVDFNDFFDGESLDQEDLVLYFNLGMHHMPDTSDLPTTVFTNAQAGVIIRPQNYLASDPSQGTRHQVNITYDGEVDYYGQAMPEGSVDLDSVNSDLETIFGSGSSDLDE